MSDKRKNLKISPELHKFIKVNAAKEEISIENFLELSIIFGLIQSNGEEIKEKLDALASKEGEPRPSLGSADINERLLAHAFYHFTGTEPGEEEKDAWGDILIKNE